MTDGCVVNIGSQVRHGVVQQRAFTLSVAGTCYPHRREVNTNLCTGLDAIQDEQSSALGLLSNTENILEEHIFRLWYLFLIHLVDY